MEPDRLPPPEAVGPVAQTRELGEPDWLCDRGYVDEYGRTWLCERVKHEPRQLHQASVFVEEDGSPGGVGWEHRLEWAEP